MKVLKILIVVLVFLSVVVWLGVKGAMTPVQRSVINEPIFTIGDANYQQALDQGKNIVKFGRMFWGLYPGGLVFSDPGEVEAFIRSNQNLLDRFSSGWAIYELSGDLAQDTRLVGNQRYLKHSVLVTRLAKEP